MEACNGNSRSLSVRSWPTIDVKFPRNHSFNVCATALAFCRDFHASCMHVNALQLIAENVGEADMVVMAFLQILHEDVQVITHMFPQSSQECNKDPGVDHPFQISA